MGPFFSQGAGGTTGFLSAVPIAMTGYGSIVAVSFMVQEVKNPNKNVPRAVLIALAIVCLLYVGMVAATLGMLTVRYLTEKPWYVFHSNVCCSIYKVISDSLDVEGNFNICTFGSYYNDVSCYVFNRLEQ